MDMIRIPWIDDRDQGGLPESTLPDRFREYFEVVDPRDRSERDGDSVFSFRDVEGFVPILERFWHGDTNVLPCEILATDYDLSESALGSNAYGAAEIDDHEFTKDRSDSSVTPLAETGTIAKISSEVVNFDGLIISTIYSCIAYRHPSALVSMTSLLAQMPSGVGVLQKMAQPFVGAKFEENLGLRKRSWENILFVGLPHLRRRIEELYESGDIVVSSDDLMTLADSADHGRLTIRSPFSTRRMPVHGLFVDIPESERNGKIQEWARKLLAMFVDCEDFKQAKELAESVWEAYRGKTREAETDLVEERKNVSLLILDRETGGSEINNEELMRLSELFKVQGNRCTSNCVDITRGGYSDKVRRWGALLVTFKLIRCLILIKKRFEECIEGHAGEEISNPEGPVLSDDDVYLALFPLPGTPLILPWHEGKNIDKSFGWVRTFMRLKDKTYVTNNVGDLALHIPDVLNGKAWSPEGPHGLRPSERLILQGITLDDEDLSEPDFFAYGPARRLLWGDDRRSRSELQRRTASFSRKHSEI